MRTFRVTLTLLAALMLGLTMTSTASAVAVGVSNGDFQTQPMQENWSDNDIWVWYDHNSAGTAGTDLVWMDEVTDTNPYSYGAGSTTVCEFTNGWNGYIYQQIGTYTENELIEVAGTMLRRDLHNTGMLRFTLHVGSGPAADNTDVYDFTDLVDTVHVDGFSLAGLPATGSSGPYPDPAASANFTTTLDSGTGHTVGDPIWLRVTADFDSWAVVAVDNISTSIAFTPADLDGNLLVDVADATLLSGKWGLTPADAGWDAGYDLDGSGQIGIGDFDILKGSWSPASASAASVPEPGSLVLLSLGSLMLLVLRRRCRV